MIVAAATRNVASMHGTNYKYSHWKKKEKRKTMKIKKKHDSNEKITLKNRKLI